MKPMTIWDVIPDPGTMPAPLTDADVSPPAIQITHLRRYRPRSPTMFDVHPGEFPLAQAPDVAKEVPVEQPREASETLVLTFDMGPWMKAHDKDRIDFEPRLGHPHRVACPPFHAHDEDQTEPVDDFLGQVVGFKPARALLFRRRDPHFLDGCEVGQRYVLMRFWDDKQGQVWSMPVEGDDDKAVSSAMLETLTLYRRYR